MTLKHCIIHRIERAVPGAEVTTQLRDQEVDTTGPAYSLFEQLKQSFQRSGQKRYGYFDRSMDDVPMPEWLRDYQNEKSSFVRLSGRMIEHLQQKLAATEEVFSSHIMVVIDSVMDQDQLYLFWLDHVDANSVDTTSDVQGTRFVDPNKLYYGTRVYLDEWLQEDSQKYIAMITARGNKALGDAFSDFVGFSTGVDLVEETNEFLSIVDQYTHAGDSEDDGDSQGQLKEQILDYCVEQDKRGAPVVFEEIASQLDDSPAGNFAQFVSQHQSQPVPEMYTDRGSLKRYVRYFGRDKNMSISFSADMFGQNIVYDPIAGSLTIKQIPKSLKQQLSGSGKAGFQSDSSAMAPTGESADDDS